MAVERSYARLGLFVILTLVVILATATLFVQRLRSPDVIEMVTFTRENVSGLDVSSPVRYRGVPVGQVSNLAVDTRSATIRIDFQIFKHRLTTIGANVRQRGGVHRVRRAPSPGGEQSGDGRVVPAARRAAECPAAHLARVHPGPDLRAVGTHAAGDVEGPHARSAGTSGKHAADTPGHRRQASRQPGSQPTGSSPTSSGIARASQLPELSADSRKFFATTSAQFGQLTSEMDRLIGTEGTLTALIAETHESMKAADIPGATKSAREAMERTSLAADDLRRTLPVIRESLDQLRELARQMDEQPESVVYGPRPAAVKPR